MSVVLVLGVLWKSLAINATKDKHGRVSFEFNFSKILL